MIYNILLLIGANILIPMIPLPPQIFIAYSVYDYNTMEPAIFNDMNMSRLYTEDEFKKSFRDSVKKLHPDRGGSQEAFDRVKNMKKIMEGKNNYYDMYNITHVDVAYSIPMKQIVQMKQYAYFFETAIFYLIALLYILAFTIDDQLKSSRYVLLPLTVGFAIYEYYVHTYPTQTTAIDYLISDKIPLFMQHVIVKRLFCILSAIIRVYFMRRPSRQKYLLHQLQKSSSNLKEENYLAIMTQLSNIYAKKVQKHQKEEKSWTTKLRGWLSNGLSLLFLGLMIWSAISPGQNAQDM